MEEDLRKLLLELQELHGGPLVNDEGDPYALGEGVGWDQDLPALQRRLQVIHLEGQVGDGLHQLRELYPNLPNVGADFGALSSEPRFQALLRNLNIPVD